MGIDIYLRWQGMTEEERAAQQTGYSVVHGHGCSAAALDRR